MVRLIASQGDCAAKGAEQTPKAIEKSQRVTIATQMCLVSVLPQRSDE